MEVWFGGRKEDHSFDNLPQHFGSCLCWEKHSYQKRSCGLSQGTCHRTKPNRERPRRAMTNRPTKRGFCRMTHMEALSILAKKKEKKGRATKYEELQVY